MVGYEPGFEFYDTFGEQLMGADLQTYMVDTLQGVSFRTKSANPTARIIAHFLGRSGVPIRLRGETIAAHDIVDLITTEISRRSKASSFFFDEFAFEIEPALLGPRLDELPEAATLEEVCEKRIVIRWPLRPILGGTSSAANHFKRRRPTSGSMPTTDNLREVRSGTRSWHLIS